MASILPEAVKRANELLRRDIHYFNELMYLLYPSQLVGAGISSILVFTTFAGLPAAMQLAGTLLVTTEFAAIMELSPIVTPFMMLTLRPIQQFSPITTGA